MLMAPAVTSVAVGAFDAQLRLGGAGGFRGGAQARPADSPRSPRWRAAVF